MMYVYYDTRVLCLDPQTITQQLEKPTHNNNNNTQQKDVTPPHSTRRIS